MGKYLKEFELTSQYEEYINSTVALLPNVSHVKEIPKVFYNPFVDIDYSQQYLTFEAIEDSTFSLTKSTCQYSLDEGETWTSLSTGTNTPTVSAGNKIMFKQAITTLGGGGIGKFISTGKFNAEGNVMSMLHGDDFKGQINITKFAIFYQLFKGCTNIVEAHNLILPATTVYDQCYYEMFKGCTSLITAPELPATTLDNSCYHNMFEGCSSLTTAPALPATTLAESCYFEMFKGCSSLVTAPALPATTLAEYCYNSMFEDCTELTIAPVLPATTLVERCYQNMFYNCSKLNSIIMLATDIITASECLDNWVSGVASTGTFVKHKDVAFLTTGNSGIPSNWEAKDNITLTECTRLTITAYNVTGNDTTTTIHYTAICNGIDYKGETVTGFVEEGTAVSAEFPQNTSETETVERTITFEFMGVTASTTIIQGLWINFEQQYLTFEAIEDSTFKLTKNACEYSLDGGDTWTSLSAGNSTPTVSAGSKIMFKATSPSISYGIGKFSSTGKFNVEGNIMSMLFGDDFIDKTDLTGKDDTFYKLFNECANIVKAHNLILPATTLANSCYTMMFDYCTSLTTAPELPATTLAKSCYTSMFCGCTSLTTAPELHATTLAENCYEQMFRDCISMTKAPELPAAKLQNYCYQLMFLGCRRLNYIKMLATNTKATNCLANWVSGVASTGTFVKHPNMTSLPTDSYGIPVGWTVVDYVA